MKIIQSFWSGNKNPLHNNYGWYSIESHYLGWTLSVNQLRLFYDKVELYTDKLGYDILIKKLNLPYTKVYVLLDELNEFPSNFWSIAKVKVYSLQDEPFLHIDGDVFVWERFKDELLDSDLVAQNSERTSDYYMSSWNLISPELIFKPSEMNDYERGNNYACNMGIFGGKNIAFLKEYANNSLDFVIKNKLIWNNIKDFEFNVFFEQVPFGQIVLNKKSKVNFLIEEEFYDNGYKNFGDFDKVSYQKKFLHLLGNFKRDANTCKMMENYVLKYYPHFFKKIVDTFPEIYKNIPVNYDFTFNKNYEWIENLKYKLDMKLSIEENFMFLISKDLLSVELPKTFNENIALNKDFLITRFLSNRIIRDLENEELKILSIVDFKNQIISFEIDEIDELLIEKINFSINYKMLISETVELLEDNAAEMKNEFKKLVIDKLYFFLKHRVIALSS